jgi:pimeloyl-ACP methyl ester carboxylesterase
MSEYRASRLSRATAGILLAALAALLTSPVAAGDRSEGFVEVENGRLFYTVEGSGLPVVLIHGGFLDHRMWDSQVPMLSNRYRAVRYDVRAHGRSSSEVMPYSDTRDLAALLDHLEIQRATIVGLSMGGMIAVNFALEYPDRVVSLVLVGPGLTGFDFDSAELNRYLGQLTDAVERQDYPGVDEIFTRYWFDGPYRQPGETDGVARAKVLDMLAGSRRRWEMIRLAEVPAPPAIERLPSIRARTLLVLGTLDMPDIVEIVNLLADELPNARRVDIPRAAHMVNMEAPDRFNELLLEFLSSD